MNKHMNKHKGIDIIYGSIYKVSIKTVEEEMENEND